MDNDNLFLFILSLFSLLVILPIFLLKEPEDTMNKFIYTDLENNKGYSQQCYKMKYLFKKNELVCRIGNTDIIVKNFRINE